MSEANYHEFTTLPEFTRAVWGNRTNGERLVLNNDDPYKWSGDAPPPPLGKKVKVYLNGLGNAIVTGYFAEYGWLGVLAKPTKPPKWWRDQTKDGGRDPATTPYHLFGIDLEPRKPVVEV